jgi:hypothetical protein
MALASWSTKRILMLWAGGLVLQVMLIVALVLVAQHLVDDSGELMRVEEEQHARWRAAELADSLSLAKQRADARVARTYRVAASGDTVFPLVHMPSARPNPITVAVRSAETSRSAQYFTVLLFGLIPTVLILVTLSWFVARRRNGGPPQPSTSPN